MALLTRKIKGTTLVEVLVAMIIVMIAFGMGLMIYINVVNSNRNPVRMELQLLMEDILAGTKREKAFFDEVIEEENLKVIKTVFPYETGNKRLQVLLLEGYKGEEKLSQVKELVIVE